MAFTDVLFLTRHLHVKALPASLLLLCLSAPLYCEDLILDYQVYLIHVEDSFSDLIAHSESYKLFHTGCARITLSMGSQQSHAFLNANKVKQSRANANITAPTGKAKTSSPLSSLMSTVAYGLSYLSSLSFGQLDEESSGDFDAKAHGYEDLSDAPKYLPVPKKESIDWLSTLYGFFHDAPDNSTWYQSESESCIRGVWQLINKTITVTDENVRSILRAYTPQEASQSQPLATGSPHFHFGWNPVADFMEMGAGCNDGILGARLTGYAYYLPLETRKRTTFPIYGLARLYQMTDAGLKPEQILGWFPEFLPTRSSAASRYGYSNMDAAYSLNLSELFKGKTMPFSRESTLSQSNSFEYFYTYSRPGVTWDTLVWQVRSHRLVMIQTNQHRLPVMMPPTTGNCLIDLDDIESQAPAKQKIPQQ